VDDRGACDSFIAQLAINNLKKYDFVFQVEQRKNSAIVGAGEGQGASRTQEKVSLQVLNCCHCAIRRLILIQRCAAQDYLKK
jgi:hypothetical protein